MTLPGTILAAVWLGILTSVSPCPLATNVAAVSFLARRAHSRRMAVAGAVVYALGRALVYVAIGLAVSSGLAASPGLSKWLQSALMPFVGPLLITVGLVLLGWLPMPFGLGAANQSTGERLARCGLLGELLLGMLFALTFCPVSAALFFGALMPLAVASPSPLLLFSAYGMGTALPVGVVAVLVALGVSAAGKMLGAFGHWQGRLQTATAVVILGIGVWLTVDALFIGG